MSLLLVTALVATGCIDAFDTTGVSVRNNTAVTLRFKTVVGGIEYPLSAVEPHTVGNVLLGTDLQADNLKTKNGCTVGDLIAMDPSGAEIARHPAPLCKGDQWVIDAAGSPSSSSG
jgi:hypothetical protein